MKATESKAVTTAALAVAERRFGARLWGGAVGSFAAVGGVAPQVLYHIGPPCGATATRLVPVDGGTQLDADNDSTRSELFLSRGTKTKRGGHQPARAWSRFATLERSDLPSTLVDAVETTVALARGARTEGRRRV